MSDSEQLPGRFGPESVDPAPGPVRRRFTAEYKAVVVAEYEAAAHGEKAAVLRREGLFHSHVHEWTRIRDADMAGRSSSRRPRKQAGDDAGSPSTLARLTLAERRAEQLRVENARLTAKLAQSQAALSIMGKAHELLASLAESSDTPPTSTR